LWAFLDCRPIAARPVGLVERVVKWARRKPGAAAVLAAGVFLAAFALWVGSEVRAERRAGRLAARAGTPAGGLRVADAAAVPALLDDLGDVRDLVGPRLVELARQPVNTRPGLNARLVLIDDPGRAAELAAYLSDCRVEELPTIRRRLEPHAAA